jgi:hypothetical protein
MRCLKTPESLDYKILSTLKAVRKTGEIFGGKEICGL